MTLKRIYLKLVHEKMRVYEYMRKGGQPYGRHQSI